MPNPQRYITFNIRSHAGTRSRNKHNTPMITSVIKTYTKYDNCGSPVGKMLLLMAAMPCNTIRCMTKEKSANLPMSPKNLEILFKQATSANIIPTDRIIPK